MRGYDAFRAGAITLALFLQACGPAGVVVDAAVRGGQVDRGRDAEKRIAEAWRSDPALCRVKVSVAVANTMASAWRDRWSVVLTGTVPSEADRQRAAGAVPSLINENPEAVGVLNYIKVERE